MNGQIPIDVDLSALHRQELLSFIVNKHDLELVFSNTRLIVEGGLEIHSLKSAAKTFSIDEVQTASASLPMFLGKNIVHAYWYIGKGLALRFSNELTLIACIDDSGFESFSFSLPHEPGIIVV